jgi:Polyketide cyclase / dehydrase and lipid transport
MRAVQATQQLVATVHDAESRWYDTSEWHAWVDGLARVASVSDGWPGVGAVVVWESGPAGRGRVTERVIEHEPLSGQTVEVEDDSIRGWQSVTFTPRDGTVEVALRLEYELVARSIITPLVDILFIRRAMTASLRATLARFAAELAGTRPPSVG